MLTNHQGNMVEYVVIIAAVLAIVGGAIIAVSTAISTKLQEINVQIGS